VLPTHHPSGSEELLIHEADVEAMAPCGPAVGGVRRFIDISVPRNIAPGINSTPGHIVYNVDDLKEVVAGNKEARAQAAAEAEVLLRCVEWGCPVSGKWGRPGARGWEQLRLRHGGCVAAGA
jgi:hypothetical protein